jgi:uncharacterized protein
VPTTSRGGGMQTQEAANIALLSEAYQRWGSSKGDSVDHWFTLIDENIKFGSIAAEDPKPHPQLAFSKAYSNKETLRGYFEGMLRDWEMLHFAVLDFIAQNDSVVMRGHMIWRNRSTNKIFGGPKLDVWRFKDGKAIEFYEYFDTAGARAAATP